MKKVFATICAVVMSFIMVAASAGTASAAMSDADYEKYCADKGMEWSNDDEVKSELADLQVGCQYNCVEVSLWGTWSDTGKIRLKCDNPYNRGSAVRSTLKFVIDIVSICIGVLGVAAIAVVGIMYLTAGPDVGKAIKARARLIEIVVGLILYALTYAILNFLIPDFAQTAVRVEEPTTSIIAQK